MSEFTIGLILGIAIGSGASLIITALLLYFATKEPFRYW